MSIADKNVKRHVQLIVSVNKNPDAVAVPKAGNNTCCYINGNGNQIDSISAVIQKIPPPDPQNLVPGWPDMDVTKRIVYNKIGKVK